MGGAAPGFRWSYAAIARMLTGGGGRDGARGIVQGTRTAGWREDATALVAKAAPRAVLMLRTHISAGTCGPGGGYLGSMALGGAGIEMHEC